MESYHSHVHHPQDSGNTGISTSGLLISGLEEVQQDPASPPASPRQQRRRPHSPPAGRIHRPRTRAPRSAAVQSSPTISSSPGSNMAMAFVNYTPHDSVTILGGVAPSGSSKTKAKREKAAAERQRKLSAAAVKAVAAAGGDLSVLSREGGLVL
ncbi:MAG: hypothetical protein M1816_007405 [Peltula sp. TS41687]|nr:MAG: hypothetical protein M1816_007405 [Peltula sp. TS41687]